MGAWVKEVNASTTQVDYTEPYVRVNFYSSVGVLVPGTSLDFNSQGLIIESWQRIHEEFTIPPTANFIEIVLGTNGVHALFDDIRIYPVDGSMQSYVYDPVSLKLVATLDENNYATFYQYDLEGNLVRTKKETERGVITIQESRQSTLKQ
ncbi:MAG: hypothetical protein COA58_13080 [Bacteroidetes bacterium]|nr:MAG: hypothetical protein COA58_13080 [Bacteroidota bacterium]